MIRQFENQTQHCNDWTYTESRYETPTDHMKTNTQYKNGPETAHDSTVSQHTTNTKHNTIAVASKAANSASIKSPKKQTTNMMQMDDHYDTSVKM